MQRDMTCEPPLPETMEDVAPEPSPQEALDDLDFAFIHSQVSGIDVFKWDKAASRGATACLKRMEHLAGPIVKFVSAVRIAEGLLSKALVEGARREENSWNIMVHELHLARQYCKYRGARSSRFATWMSSQESLAATAGKPSSGEDDAPVAPLQVFRPISATKVQFVLFQHSVEQLITFKLGLVTSIYRGSVSKAKGSSRRITMSKPLCTSSPPNVVAKIRVLVLEPLDEKAMFATTLCEQLVVDVASLCGEVPSLEEGVKGSVFYVSFSEDTMKIVQDLNSGTLNFGKKAPSKSNDKDPHVQEFQTYTIKSFTKSAAGEENIKCRECFQIIYCCFCGKCWNGGGWALAGSNSYWN